MVLWFKENTEKLIVLLLFLSFRSHSITKYKKITVLVLNSSCSIISENDVRPFRNRRCIWACFSCTTWTLIAAFFFNIKNTNQTDGKRNHISWNFRKWMKKSPVQMSNQAPYAHCANTLSTELTGQLLADTNVLRELYPPVVVLIAQLAEHSHCTWNIPGWTSG